MVIFKNRIKQAIYLRGSADFNSVAEYQALIEVQVAKLNQQCQAKYEQEKDHSAAVTEVSNT